MLIKLIRNIILSIVFVVASFSFAKDVLALCYYSGDLSFNTCMSLVAPHVCYDTTGTIPYACCDILSEICPPEITPTPTTPVPTIPPGASCYFPGVPEFNDCFNNINSEKCLLGGLGSLTYACCNNPSDTCPSVPEHGYYVCNWATTNCYNNPINNQCGPGYYPHASNFICNTLPGDVMCYSVAIGCITDERPYYCSPNFGCDLCPTTGCPTGVPTYSNRAECTSGVNACNLIGTCASSGGICRNACFPSETPSNSATCPGTNVCCLQALGGGACRGYFSQLPGNCFFLDCPDGYVVDGVYPFVCNPMVNHGTTCCVSLSLTQIIPRPAFSPLCPNGINTAIGCVTVTTNIGFISFLLGWAIGVGGGVTFLGIVFAGFLILTSGGDKERLKAGKELFGSALGGLLMIVFSVYLLELVGVRIFRIPGL